MSKPEDLADRLKLLRSLTGHSLQTCKQAADMVTWNNPITNDILVAVMILDSAQLAVNIQSVEKRHMWNYERAVAKANRLRENNPEIAKQFPTPDTGPEIAIQNDDAVKTMDAETAGNLPSDAFRLSKVFPHFLPDALEDCEVVGTLNGQVVHFKKDTCSVDTQGLTPDDWKNGHPDTWCMTENEALRIGVTNYAAYVAELQRTRPKLMS